MDLNQYLEIFVEESKEHIEDLNTLLLEIEKNPTDRELIDNIFRAAHTLKGMAATMGFTKMGDLTHKMEDVLSEVRADKLKVSPDLIDVLLKCSDVLALLLNNIEISGSEGDADISSLFDTLEKYLSVYNTLKENREVLTESVNTEVFNEYDRDIMKKAFNGGFKCYHIEVFISKDCVLKSARAYVVFNILEKIGDIFKSIPSVEDIEDEKFENQFTVFLISKASKEDILEKINSIAEIEKCIVEEINQESINAIPNLQDNLNTVKEDVEDGNKSKKIVASRTIRVDTDRLDKLMNLVSELIIIKTRLLKIQTSIQDTELNTTIEYLDRITTNLNDAVMKVRMVPIERVFNRFPRMVRDLSKELNKEIELKLSGEDTEVDRTVIDEISEPLVHLIRNAIDHGIEAPEVRIKKGKPSKGTVYLRAFHDGNNVVIEVEDDGEGINFQNIKKKAIEKGLISSSDADNLTDNEMINYLFMPGFSTSEKVTDISGRGVGLDVVKNKIESLGGFVDVISNSGKGTIFSIKLPLTLAIIQALLVNLKNEIYAIPLNSIKEIVTIERNDIKFIQNKEVMIFRGEVVQLIRLGELLGVPEYSLPQKELTVVITKRGEKYSGILVDSLIGQQEIVIKSLGKYLSGIKSIAGATILGDGDVALIIDTNFLIN
ncbi:chemotaxis protein CheA [Calorimonas adulescens]|uniref:Chemotaxis protein CheA n=1 Tax=Calorimonas adulescens TaxID=2606906 RepID=A0A5D8QFN4_9THEO|nr:chemotaxis protein CheA [Calorimonas adulescens]TZE83332.1 chemotaxis protein CheA [Calorimonas adulescens]